LVETNILREEIAVTDCNQIEIKFPGCQRREVEASFTGGDVSSDGGVLLLRQADRKLGLTGSVAKALTETRRKKSCRHSLVSMLRQRVYGLCLGYEDLNDHNRLRGDAALQTAVQRDGELAGASTLCRWENRSDRETAWAIHRILVEQFIASYKRAPKEIVLDFDATDTAVHGQQEGRFFHGYYDQYCFLPLYVFCGDRLLVAYLRQSKIDGAKHAWAILALLVKRIRRACPKVKIIFRGDSGFCRHQMLSWCERHNVGYIIGVAKNNRLKALSEEYIREAAEQFTKTGLKQRLFDKIQYAADTWNCRRSVIVKAEHTDKGPNPRYVVTNLQGEPQALYDKLYCARGDMENRIKEQQLDLFSGRASCHAWWANQFRLLLSSLGYTLMEAIRRLALKGTELSKAQSSTIRLKLLKIGAVIIRNTRRIRFMLSSAYPYQKLFAIAAARLDSG
jgi:hypothetical protein